MFWRYNITNYTDGRAFSIGVVGYCKRTFCNCSLLSEKIIYYLSFHNITFLINLMGELVYLLH